MKRLLALIFLSPLLIGEELKEERFVSELTITELTETQERIRIEVNAAYNDYDLAIDNYFTEKENLRLAERIEKKNQIKFFEGIVQSFELRLAQVQLYTAQNNFVAAIQSVIFKKIQFQIVLLYTDEFFVRSSHITHCASQTFSN